MTANGQNFEMHQGDSKEIHILVTDEETGLALDLSPYISGTIIWVAYDKQTKVAILSKSYGSGIAVPTPSNGEIVITLAPSDTENITPKIYNHECEISSGLSNVATVTTGTLTMLYSKA